MSEFVLSRKHEEEEAKAKVGGAFRSEERYYASGRSGGW